MTTIVCLGVACDDNRVFRCFDDDRVFRCSNLDGKVTERARACGNYGH